MNFLLITCVILFKHEAVFGSSASVQLDDFDELARNYAQQKSRDYDRSLSWWDIYGRHQHLMERPQYDKYKIAVWTDNIKYGVVQKSIEKPGYVYTQWFHNGQSVPLVTEFRREVQLQNTYSWSVSTSVKINTEIKANAGIPDVLGVSTYMNSSINLQSSKAQTKQERETYEVKNIVTVPANRSVKAEFVVTERDVQVPWEAEVEISGWIAMWFEPKHNGHWLWFHNILSLANSKFRTTSDGRRLQHHTKGMFTGLRGVDTVLKTYEYELQSRSYYNLAPEPISVHTYKPNLKKIG